MPLIRIDQNEDYSLGFWKISETYEELISGLNLCLSDQEVVEGFGSELRKLEWLSVRALLKSILKNDIGIYYNENRKPFLRDHSYNISISHSHELTSVLLSKKHHVGIDLEFMSHRIRKIKHKFINKKEYIALRNDDGFYHMYLHWCAKEALYKICDKQGLNFKYNLIIEPFEPEEKGETTGNVIREGEIEKFKLNYSTYENYSIVWCLK